MSDVIVVDANNDSVAMLGWYLARHGHEVRHAGTVGEAFELIAERAPQALIIDLDLPNMSGHEFLSGLRTRDLATDAQIVVLGQESSARTAIRSWELGVDEHLVRPVGPEVIAEVLAREPSYNT